MRQRYVLGFAFNEELDKVLLIEKKQPEWQAGHLNGVGGKFEPGENGVMAMVREFEEEVGIISFVFDWSEVGIMESEDFIVEVFCSNVIDINEMKQMEAEIPTILAVDYLHQYKHLPNLDILIPFCKNVLSGVEKNSPYLRLEY